VKARWSSVRSSGLGADSARASGPSISQGPPVVAASGASDRITGSGTERWLQVRYFCFLLAFASVESDPEAKRALVMAGCQVAQSPSSSEPTFRDGFY